MSTRPCVVAGRFYPRDKETLQGLLSSFIRKDLAIHENAVAVIAPHAGYIYSGKTAGMVYSSVNIPETVIVLSPNHTGLGHPISLDPSEKWETPFGWLEADLELIKKIKEEVKEAELDPNAQAREHALEVHLPFIKQLNPKTRIVPITVSGLPFPIIQKLGKALGKIMFEAEKNTGNRPLIVASSDMTHFESVDSAKKKDMKAIDRIITMDTQGFVSYIEENDISICGLYTISTAMEAVIEYSRLKGSSPKAELIDYTNSGVVTGDTNEVVAYAGLVIDA